MSTRERLQARFDVATWGARYESGDLVIAIRFLCDEIDRLEAKINAVSDIGEERCKDLHAKGEEP